MKHQITFITGNPAKAEQLSRHLEMPVLHKKLDIPEIQSLNLSTVVEYKAKHAFGIVQTPVLVEDTGLIFTSMGKLPGPLIKWFLQELGNAGLCELLNTYPDRTATAQVVCGLYDGHDLHLFDGEAKGSIAVSPRGNEGFGWDPIFIPTGYTQTWGEMSTEEQDASSMRRLALKKVERYLKETYEECTIGTQ